jgi:hypothetical protein
LILFDLLYVNQKMTTELFLLSDLKIGKYYKLITYRHGIRMTEITLRQISKEHIKTAETLGQLVQIRQVGRPYDPDIMLYFKQADGKQIVFEPSFGLSEAYIEYEPETEELSRIRTQERVRLLALEIQGNDWALRPENVVATQGIDVSRFAP